MDKVKLDPKKVTLSRKEVLKLSIPLVPQIC